MAEIGSFPARLKPISVRPPLTDLDNAINYNEIYEQLMELNLHIYMPTAFVFPSCLDKYVDPDTSLSRAGRELGIRRLMSINLLKRLESSVHAFRLTLGRIERLITDTIREVDDYEAGKLAAVEVSGLAGDEVDFDDDDQNMDFFAAGRGVKIELADKIEHPINPGNKRVLIFSAFSDTAEYLYEQVSRFVKGEYGLDTGMVTGSVEGKTTIPRFRATLSNVLTCFSPISKDKDTLMPGNPADISVLIGTDCISEGQNLQDCDYCVNYDIHWNPVRIIQRFGRIDRIGSRNAFIQLVNFWPDLTLDDYINLKNRVKTRMKISVLTATGDDESLYNSRITFMD